MLIEDRLDGIRFLKSNAVSRHPGVLHGFLTRVGGVSPAPYDSLNLDERGADAGENVSMNRDALMRAFRLATPPVTLNQVHGSTIITVDDTYLRSAGGKKDADAVITALPGVPVGVLTADCVPILMYDAKKGAAAAVHAGWRGTLGMVAKKSVEAMRNSFGSNPEDILAAIGPHIGPCCYTVREDVRASFRESFGERADGAFIELEDLRLDLGKANAEALLLAGLRPSNIEMKAPCTACSRALFFSYRRDGAATGRQLSFIMISKIN